MELIAGFEKLKKTQLGITLLEQEAWRVQVYWVDQAWMVYCYSCISTDFLVDHLPLGGQWRGFSLCSSISSSITRLGVIFVFASLFPTLFLLIVAVFMINYGLECFANLGITYSSYFAHILFEYKLALEFL